VINITNMAFAGFGLRFSGESDVIYAGDLRRKSRQPEGTRLPAGMGCPALDRFPAGIPEDADS
jgi:hypothetical protein